MPPTSSTLAAGTHTPKWVAELSSSIFLFACSIVAAEEVRTAIQAVALAVLASGHASMRQAARLAASRAPVIVREYVPHFNLGRIIPNRHGNKLRRRLDWAAHVRDLTGQEFVRRYKLPPKAFRALVRKLSPALRKDPKYARNAGTEPIAVVLNVALTLRFLAGARMIELVDIFGLDAATACRKDNTKDDFNHYLSKSRINVECAFGILVRRFGVLRIPMGYSLKNIAAITEACMKLHNICIDNLVEETKPLEEDCTHKDHCGRARRQDKHAFPAPEGNKKRQNEAKRVALWHSIVARGLKRPKVKAGDLKRKRKQPA
eukprot:jgi/Tetstr1/435143/TSEL_000228.t1